MQLQFRTGCILECHQSLYRKNRRKILALICKWHVPREEKLYVESFSKPYILSAGVFSILLRNADFLFQSPEDGVEVGAQSGHGTNDDHGDDQAILDSGSTFPVAKRSKHERVKSVQHDDPHRSL